MEAFKGGIYDVRGNHRYVLCGHSPETWSQTSVMNTNCSNPRENTLCVHTYPQNKIRYSRNFVIASSLSSDHATGLALLLRQTDCVGCANFINIIYSGVFVYQGIIYSHLVEQVWFSTKTSEKNVPVSGTNV